MIDGKTADLADGSFNFLLRLHIKGIRIKQGLRYTIREFSQRCNFINEFDMIQKEKKKRNKRTNKRYLQAPHLVVASFQIFGDDAALEGPVVY